LGVGVVTIKIRLLSGFGAVILLIAALAAVAVISNIRTQANYDSLVGDEVPALNSLNAALLAGLRTVEATSELVQMLLEQHHQALDRVADRSVANLISALPAGSVDEMKAEIDEQQELLARSIEAFVATETVIHGRPDAPVHGVEHNPERIEELGLAVLAKSKRVVALIEARAGLPDILMAQKDMVETDPPFFALQSVIAERTADLARQRAEAATLMQASTWSVIGFGGLALVVGLAVTQLVAGSVSRPVARLRAAVARLGSGDFAAADELRTLRTSGEIADLAASFRRMAADLAEAKEKEQRQERLSALGQIAGTVSHELRNPLATIRNSIDILRKTTDGKAPGAERAIARIDRSVQRCDAIVGDILEFSRVQDLNREPTSIDDWLQEMLDEHELPSSIRMHRALAAGAGIMLDRMRFRQVLVNLVDNAAQAMADPQWQPDPDRERTITVRTELAGPHIRLSVGDNGPGIAADKLSKIFDPLFTTKTKGVGLGLPTVRKLVEQHGGTIDVESREGGGTTFTVWLPRLVSDAEPSARLVTAA
jgi:signal transduction histidine kinase